MRSLFVASELYPFVKTGGLGDIAGALPQALIEEGADIRLLVPGYPGILQNLKNETPLRKLEPFFGRNDAQLLSGRLNGIPAYVIDCPSFYDRISPYGDENGKDWADNHLRFAALCRVAADIHLYDAEWKPDVIHANDWQCGLIPAYLQSRGNDRPRCVFTIHNMAYQGNFPASVLRDINLPQHMFTVNGVEYYGKVSFMKAGLQYADIITTVSPTYAKEIQSSEFGCGMDGILRERSNVVVGILNGIDTQVWNSETDQIIKRTYTIETLKNKAINRTSLIEKCQLQLDKSMPVFGVISRLVSQKGLDLLVQAAPEVLKMGAAFVILGSGDEKLERQFRTLSTEWPAQVHLSTYYDEPHAHEIIAGADCVIVPSRFEPCGLVQMYALCYGTLPLVRNTGGLADTVVENGDASTGFVFENAEVKDLSLALVRACALYRSTSHWKKRQVNAMQQDFGWSISAKKYLAAYGQIPQA